MVRKSSKNQENYQQDTEKSERIQYWLQPPMKTIY